MFNPSNSNQQAGLSIISVLCLCVAFQAYAQVLPEAELGIKIPLANKPVSRPMSIAYAPTSHRYYVADGGLTAMMSENGMSLSPSPIEIYDDKGAFINSCKPGLDNRSIYFNEAKQELETVTYNISSAAGFFPNTGIFSLDVDDKGDLKGSTNEISGHNPAFGDPSTIPTYDPVSHHYFAKQGRSNKVWVVDLAQREKVGEIALDLTSAGVAFDDLADYHIAYTGVTGEELAILDVDHKSVLVFDINGKFISKSALPGNLKLHAQNHISGLGYTNGMFFVYNEPEGEFGTFCGFKIFEQPQ